MRIPRWLLPVIAVIAALAVGVAAVLIGMRFAPAAPASAFVPPETETATVLAPLPIEDGDAGEDIADPEPPADDEGEVYDVDESAEPVEADDPGASLPTGEREVAVAEEDPAETDGELLRLIDLIGLSPDLLAGLMRLGLGERDDDPCAPRDGSAPADGCPPGVAGTILYSEPLPPLWMTVHAWPKTHAELRDGAPADHDMADLFCEAAPREEGSADVRVRVTAPGTFTLRYWPSDHPERAESIVTTSSDAQIDAWEGEAADLDHGWWITEHCLRLPGVDLGAAYTAVVSGTDIFGRDVAPQTVLFNGDGSPIHPGLQVQPVGQNLLMVSALHAEDEVLQTHAYFVDAAVDTDTPAGTAATCDAADGSRFLRPLTVVDHVAVDAAERNRQNAPEEFTEKLVQSYRIPEGATVLVCARWTPAGDVPSWTSDQSDFESSVIVQTADRMLPVLTLVGFEPRDDRGVTVEFRASTTNGLDCGRLGYVTDGPLDQLICGSWGLGGGTAGADGDRLFDRGFTNDLVLRTDARLSSGETSESTYEIPAGVLGSCVGVCTLPPTRVFGVSTIGGTALIEQSWETGLQNGGREDWFLSTVESAPIDYVRPDVPQLDLRADWTYTRPNISSPYITASITVPVDRPVEWELTSLANNYGGTEGAACGPDEATPSGSGSSRTSGTGEVIALSMRVCVGGFYYPTLTLTDDDGNVAVWSAVTGERVTFWGYAGTMNVPRLEGTIRYRLDAWDVGRSYVQQLTVTAESERVVTNDYAFPVGTRCSADGVIKSEGSFEWAVAANILLGMSAKVVPQRYAGRDGCAGWTDDVAVVPSVTNVSLLQLTNRDGVVITTPEGDRVHFWFDPAPAG